MDHSFCNNVPDTDSGLAAQRKPNEKPGTCPPLFNNQGECPPGVRNACKSDDDCLGNFLKCCNMGCRLGCVDIKEVNSSKAGMYMFVIGCVAAVIYGGGGGGASRD